MVFGARKTKNQGGGGPEGITGKKKTRLGKMKGTGCRIIGGDGEERKKRNEGGSTGG